MNRPPMNIIPPKASDILRTMNERLPNMDKDTLAFLVLWFKLMSDVELEEATLRAGPPVFGSTMASNPMGPVYHSVANLIRTAGQLSREDLDRIWYGVQP